jgi:hypothetical protein
LINAVLVVVEFADLIESKKPNIFVATFIQPTQVIIHWLITQSYIRTAFEAKSLIDPEIYFQNEDKLQGLQKFNSRMKIANVTVSIFIVAFTVLVFMAYKTVNNKLISIF